MDGLFPHLFPLFSGTIFSVIVTTICITFDLLIAVYFTKFTMFTKIRRFSLSIWVVVLNVFVVL